MTLQEILLRLNDLDAAAEPVPETEWATMSEDLGDKVDAIKTVADRLSNESARLLTAADEFVNAAQSVEKNRKRLLEYVAWSMQQTGAEKLPGKLWRLDLRQNPVSVEIDRTATELDAFEFPDLVEQKTSWSWNRAAIKDVLQNAKGAVKLRGMKLKQGHHVRFEVRKEK